VKVPLTGLSGFYNTEEETKGLAPEIEIISVIG